MFWDTLRFDSAKDPSWFAIGAELNISLRGLIHTSNMKKQMFEIHLIKKTKHNLNMQS